MISDGKWKTVTKMDRFKSINSKLEGMMSKDKDGK